MTINPNYANVILTLSNHLIERNIPHTVNVIWDGLQIHFPWNNGDLVCHSGSYGHTSGMAESMGCPWDNGDCSPITIKDALERITEWYGEIGV